MQKENSCFDFVENGGVSSPAGFLSSGAFAGLKQSGKADMALLYSERECSFAGTFTSNLFSAAPVRYCREVCASMKTVRAMVINSGVANACTGLEGYNNARATAAEAAKVLKIDDPRKVLVASTGHIGDQLPMEKIFKGIRDGAGRLSPRGGADAARAIMTTDTCPKELAVSFTVGGKKVTLGGMCKGAGMISPRMVIAPHATMICCVTTDAAIGNDLLSRLLEKSVEGSFNRITVDSDMSTNDTVVVFANGASGVRILPGTEEERSFAEALDMVTAHLARAIVYDGEGVTKFITVSVTGAKNDADAEKCARAIANSPLCKTAWFGGDPNWGRILAAAGYSGASFRPENFSLFFDDVPVIRGGLPAGTQESEMAEVMKQREFAVKVDLGAGESSATVWTGDFTYDYVKINADYRT
ncbi:MAG: bifunctional glutamate N-acetyltransferase/amino-acid acetyltransferase ArgJ [Lentisphaeria bacterium]|nr:bifunctional glutamate N-acetyltransferase/amino-acid acetyltransferase ArgJ [Lentisphaeria bacterium]